MGRGRGRKRQRPGKRKQPRQPKKTHKPRLLVICDDQENLDQLISSLPEKAVQLEGIVASQNGIKTRRKSYDAILACGELSSNVIGEVNTLRSDIVALYLRSANGEFTHTTKGKENSRNRGLIDLIEGGLGTSGVVGSMTESGRHRLPAYAGTDPSEIRSGLSMYSTNAGEREQTITTLEQALIVNPRDLDLRHSLAHLYLRVGDFAKAHRVAGIYQDAPSIFIRAQASLALARQKDKKTLAATIRDLESLDKTEVEGTYGQIRDLLLLGAYAESNSPEHLARAATLSDGMRDVTEGGPGGTGPFESHTAGLKVDLSRAAKSYRTAAGTIFGTGQYQIKFNPTLEESTVEKQNHDALWERRKELIPITAPKGCVKARLEIPRWMRVLPNNALMWPTVPMKRMYRVLSELQGREDRKVDARRHFLQHIIDYNALIEHFGTMEMKGLVDAREYRETPTVSGSQYKLKLYAARHLEALDRLAATGLDISEEDRKTYISLVRPLIEKPLIDDLDFQYVWFTDPQIDNWLGRSIEYEGKNIVQLGRIDFATNEVRHGLDNTAMVCVHELAKLSERERLYLHTRGAALRLAYRYKREAEEFRERGKKQVAAELESHSREIVESLPKSYRHDGKSRMVDVYAKHLEARGGSYDYFTGVQVPAAELDRHFRILSLQADRLNHITQSIEPLRKDKSRSGLMQAQVHTALGGENVFDSQEESLEYYQLEKREDGRSILRGHVYGRIRRMEQLLAKHFPPENGESQSPLHQFYSDIGILDIRTLDQKTLSIENLTRSILLCSY